MHCFRFGGLRNLDYFWNVQIAFRRLSRPDVVGFVSIDDVLRFSRYSLTSFRFSVVASFALAISLRKIMLMAASGPITAISADGQARFTSARMCLLPSTS